MQKRDRMLEQLTRHGFSDARVLAAMKAVRRHAFVPSAWQNQCDPYGDHPCPIGFDQTISQPFIVAHMTAAMAIEAGENVLEIGTGSGYQAAILATLGARVTSIEIIPALAEHARQALAAEGIAPVTVITGDGYEGWPPAAPYDVILVTCAPESVPERLVEQLAEGGRMIVPVGLTSQSLVILRKQDGQIHRETDLNVRFVPMVPGRAKP